MKELITGQIGDFGVGYEAKIEDGKLVVGATVDFAALITKAESALPEGSLKPIEVAVLEIVKQAVKGV